jgi:putative phosphoesterase
LAGADLILHAGDFTDPAILERLRSLAPVAAVRGNVDSPDLRRELPEHATVEASGATIGLIHDAGPVRGRLERLRRLFPEADAVVFGHSHMPLHERSGGFQIFNPGSPTERRRSPERCMGMATAARGGVRFRHVGLG